MNEPSYILRSRVEREENWREWCGKIPPLHFDSDWDVYIIPPFGGALTRVVVKKNGKQVSVYFDAYSLLGYMYNEDKPIPYFEIYPSPDGEPRRYLLDETERMMEDIRTVLNTAES